MFCVHGVISFIAFAEPVVKVTVREVLELAARKSGREIVEKGAREVAEQTLERCAEKFGNKTFDAAADGGLELIEATTKYGDDVMRFAVEASPVARRVLALNAETLLPLARRVGPEALEVEAKTPGLATKVYADFGIDGGKTVAKSLPADDIPRLVEYAEKADSQDTRNILLQTYQKEGKKLFERIPPRSVLADGLTADMLSGTNRLTQPVAAISDVTKDNPNSASDVAKYAIRIGALIVILLIVLLLWRFNLMPWNRR